MKKTAFRIGLISLLAVAMLLAACGPTETATPTAEPGTDETEEPTTPPPTPEPGGETAEPGTQPTPVPSLPASIVLDPAIATDGDSLMVSRYIYEGLVGLDGDEPVPALAVDWIVSDDGLDYIFQLRPNVFFHDGSPLNADAVLANFNRWFDPEHPLRGSASYYAWQELFFGFKGEVHDDGTDKCIVDGIEKVNDLTVVIHLNRAEPDLLAKLADVRLGIASPTALANSGAAYGTAEGATAGTGPYFVAEWTGDSLTLAPHPTYWTTMPAEGLEFPLE
jgi:peptide/nickel transport system substrate-binding protein